MINKFDIVNTVNNLRLKKKQKRRMIKMNINILRGYIISCKVLGVEPTWAGLQEINRNRRRIINSK